MTTTAAPARATKEAALAAWPGSKSDGGEAPHTGELQPVPLNAPRALLVTMTAMLLAFAMWLGVTPLRRRTRLAFAPLAVFAMVAGLALLAACGGGGGGGGQTGTPAGTYNVTITATAGTQTATTTVSVTVQ